METPPLSCWKALTVGREKQKLSPKIFIGSWSIVFPDKLKHLSNPLVWTFSQENWFCFHQDSVLIKLSFLLKLSIERPPESDGLWHAFCLQLLVIETKTLSSQPNRTGVGRSHPLFKGTGGGSHQRLSVFIIARLWAAYEAMKAEASLIKF